MINHRIYGIYAGYYLDLKGICRLYENIYK